ncbi:uncharacterized protein LOC121738808 isoform X3 [Aricia agestis]|uniref:uncharacterized protein LOC121738808 isoform X3 n=1 Tax=Aricia agestis TaxID=91739 RepID=UPI001C2046A2|nr:uncharacterized protein LOC121738808 isoform X3 [Aricia agestis]
MAKNTDSLFLFEVLVDKVIFSKIPCFFDRDFKTCINIKCPAIEPLEICDEDTSNFPDSKGPFLKVFSSGKSCLFFLKENEISSCTSSFPVKVSIYKALPCGCLPTKIIMGECTIDMTKEFMESRQKFLANPKDVSYQALKDSFRFVGPDGTETGEILMFLRISCFGNNIVTQFQGTNHASLGDSVVDRSCDPRNEFQSKEDPCACGATHGLKTGKHDACPPAEDKYNSMPCEEPEDPCYCSGPRAQKKQDLGCRNTFPYCLHVPKDCCPTGNKVVFQMPTGLCDTSHKQRAHFNFTSDGVGDVSRDEPDQLMPANGENYPGVVYDFPNQVIKLRIGKTIEMPGHKQKFEYNFITPVATNEKTVPTHDTRPAQCHTSCPCCCKFCCR